MKLVSAIDVARRDNQPTVQGWIRVTAIQMKMKGYTPMLFDGTITGKPVFAFVSNGRWLAVCDRSHCDGCEYVDSESAIFFCMKCSNGNGKARPVVFPARLKEIEDALLERPMMPVAGGDLVTQAFNARPANPALRRDWAPTALQNHPSLTGRVIVDSFGESPETIRKKTQEV